MVNGYLLDTNIVIEFFRKYAQIQALVASLGNRGPLRMSLISLAELRTGWSAEQAAFFLPRLESLVEIEPITKEIVLAAGQLQRRYKAQGKPLHTVDTIIAATAVAGELCMVTRNLRHFEVMTELDIYRDLPPLTA
jgi:tRNA(fMet)-specific endonuclease VapC